MWGSFRNERWSGHMNLRVRRKNDKHHWSLLTSTLGRDESSGQPSDSVQSVRVRILVRVVSLPALYHRLNSTYSYYIYIYTFRSVFDLFRFLEKMCVSSYTIYIYIVFFIPQNQIKTKTKGFLKMTSVTWWLQEVPLWIHGQSIPWNTLSNSFSFLVSKFSPFF